MAPYVLALCLGFMSGRTCGQYVWAFCLGLIFGPYGWALSRGIAPVPYD